MLAAIVMVLGITLAVTAIPTYGYAWQADAGIAGADRKFKFWLRPFIITGIVLCAIVITDWVISR